MQTPLEPDQIENRNTYFCGYFDDQDRLLGLKKMVYGECELQHRYEYDPSGVLRRADIIDVDGEATVLVFDEEGRAYQA